VQLDKDLLKIMKGKKGSVSKAAKDVVGDDSDDQLDVKPLEAFAAGWLCISLMLRYNLQKLIRLKCFNLYIVLSNCSTLT